MAALVVLEAHTEWHRTIWAWCRVGDHGAGFEEVSYTEADGLTPVTHVGSPPRLGRTVFAVEAR